MADDVDNALNPIAPEDYVRSGTTIASTAWVKQSLQDVPGMSVIVDGIKATKATVSTVANVLVNIIEIVKTILDVVLKLVGWAADVTAEALKAAIDAVRALVNDIFSDANCHVILIPPSNPIPAYVQAPSYILNESPDGSAFDMIEGRRNGNAGFYATVADSLNDQLDLFRPQYSSDAYVAGAVIVAGSSTYIELLPWIRTLVKLLSGPDGEGIGSMLVNTDLPYPKNVRASMMTTLGLTESRHYNAGDQSHPYAVRLDWDLDDRIQTVNAYGRIEIKEITIYRSDKPLPKNRSLEDFEIATFPFDDSVTMGNKPNTYKNAFYDGDIEMGKTYYYGVLYTIDVDDMDGTTTSETSFTNIAIPETGPVLTRGNPPDWTAWPSPLAIIPGVREFVTKINLFLDVLEDRITSSSDKIKKYIEALEREIERWKSWLEDIINTVNQLIQAFDFPDVYVGMHVFYGQGGNQFFLSDLGGSLMNQGDPNAPPFTLGTEAVCGLVFLAGSELAGQAKKAYEFFNTLFGSASMATPASYINEATASIDALVEDTERHICFEDNLLAKLCEDLCPTAEVPPSAVSESLEPSTESAECGKVT